MACEGSRLIWPKWDAEDGGCVFQNSNTPGVHTIVHITFSLFRMLGRKNGLFNVKTTTTYIMKAYSS